MSGKNVIILVACCAVFFLGGVLFAQQLGYPDVPSDAWFYEDVMEMSDYGVVKGYDDGTYRPGDDVNRAEIATMFSRYDSVVDAQYVSVDELEALVLSILAQKEELSRCEQIRVRYIIRPEGVRNKALSDAGCPL